MTSKATEATREKFDEEAFKAQVEGLKPQQQSALMAVLTIREAAKRGLEAGQFRDLSLNALDVYRYTVVMDMLEFCLRQIAELNMDSVDEIMLLFATLGHETSKRLAFSTERTRNLAAVLLDPSDVVEGQKNAQ